MKFRSGSYGNGWRLLVASFMLLSMPGLLQAQNFPWPEGEKLLLEIFWPGGATMGEAVLDAKSVKDAVFLSANVEVAMPQGTILYKFSSTATGELCSREFKRSVQRSGKSWEEMTSFDAETGKARVSRDGQTRELPAAKCARDPLTYLYYYRSQVAAGKKPSAETLFLAGPLPLRIAVKGKEQIKVSRIERQAERYEIIYPVAVGAGTVELWLDGSAQQKPLAVRLPLPLATFSAELR